MASQRTSANIGSESAIGGDSSVIGGDSSVIGGESAELSAVLHRLNHDQIRWVIARGQTTTSKEACEKIGENYGTFGHIPRETRKLMDEAVRLMAHDGVVTALHIRRQALSEAMAVKRQGLSSDDERIRQSVATELIEWELGKATARLEHSVDTQAIARVLEMFRARPEEPDTNG